VSGPNKILKACVGTVHGTGSLGTKSLDQQPQGVRAKEARMLGKDQGCKATGFVARMEQVLGFTQGYADPRSGLALWIPNPLQGGGGSPRGDATRDGGSSGAFKLNKGKSMDFESQGE
jgi:hypothetical protein